MLQVDSKVKEPKDDLISKLVVEQVDMTISDLFLSLIAIFCLSLESYHHISPFIGSTGMHVFLIMISMYIGHCLL